MRVMDAINSGDGSRGVRASFMRGGTSKGVFFRWQDLPADRDDFLCSVIGSPDPNGRQLDGMGGGISSLSKAMLVRRSERDGVDVDYLFAQVAVDRAMVDYGGNCGNLSSAVGCFAVNQGMVALPDGPGIVRMFNENTAKRVDCGLEVRRGRAVVAGDLVIAGVAGAGAAIRLDFLEPGRTRTNILVRNGLFPGGMDCLGATVAPGAAIAYSFVDAGNPCVFVAAPALGLAATLTPGELAGDARALAMLGKIRRWAGVEAGLGSNSQQIPGSVPKVAIVGPPACSMTLSGERIAAEDCDLQVRMISMGQPHLAIPLTGAMCTAVAAHLPETIVARTIGRRWRGGPLRIGTPSGVVPAEAEVRDGEVRSASVFRTARLLMEGTVYG